ncbi:serine/threonine-protein phosphatase 6 regulatory ankyrin repeat subunit C-like [Gigantopelta aegis]|uniref:serine/threonine-protein phosphatase 6 regulatory ankyrin repeat subunit C-like n=1 Tax=Gigantopelta aegis TaxID=1735272 RepID=UPI001B889111|nr:serine/threonine-protein phosphatase 6 regulatory ankyrin repeat subunit C-like [Gigantopelta aegis]
MDKCGRTALHHCVENTNTDCADFLLKKDTSLLNTPDNEGLTPLHMSAITGNEAMLHLLLKKGANLTCLDEEKHTVVHWATVSGQTEILDLLIEHGAELSTPDSHLAYPIHYAAQMAGRRSRPPVDGNQGTILKQLLDLKVDMSVMDKDGRQPLLWAASAGNVDACKTLVQAGADVEAKDKDGLTALHCAASRGHTSVIEELVSQCSANIDAVDKNMCTPLFYAITLGNIDSVKMLIQLGANTSHCDNKGRSPAHCAAIQGSQETLVLLQRKNVDLWLPSKQGDYPIHEAALGGHEGKLLFSIVLK